MVSAKNNKVNNCAYVSIAILTVNLSILFCLQMKKSLNIRKAMVLKMFLHLHSELLEFFVWTQDFS